MFEEIYREEQKESFSITISWSSRLSWLQLGAYLKLSNFKSKCSSSGTIWVWHLLKKLIYTCSCANDTACYVPIMEILLNSLLCLAVLIRVFPILVPSTINFPFEDMLKNIKMKKIILWLYRWFEKKFCEKILSQQAISVLKINIGKEDKFDWLRLCIKWLLPRKQCLQDWMVMQNQWVDCERD